MNILFFDSECLMCNYFINIVYNKDANQQIFYSDYKSSIAHKFNIKENENSMVFLKDETLYIKSNAFIEIYKTINYNHNFILCFEFIPVKIRDFIYDLIANNRYIFGIKKNNCSLDIEKRILR